MAVDDGMGADGPPCIPERHYRAWERRSRGETFHSIGLDFGVSGERIKQLVARAQRALRVHARAEHICQPRLTIDGRTTKGQRAAIAARLSRGEPASELAREFALTPAWIVRIGQAHSARVKRAR